MTTDRELLELAAKAIGIHGQWMRDNVDAGLPRYVNTEGVYYYTHEGSCVLWNPIVDDGDFLELASKLGLNANAPRMDVMREAASIGSKLGA